jgi:flagellar biosynthesis protein FlhG
MSGEDGDADLEIEEPSEGSDPHDVVEPVEPAPGARTRAHLLAFAAGRGGTGRSLIAANIAVYLAQAGKKVVAIDADPAGGSLHQLLGAPRPPRGFGEFLRGRADGLGELLVDTPIAGVSLVGGEGSAFGGSKPRQTAKAVLGAIADLEVDYVVLDLGPPDSTLVLDLWRAADVPVLVTLPDPASIEATYRFVRSAFMRRLRSARLDRLIANPAGPPPAALDLYRAARAGGGPTERLEQEIRRYRPTFVVNQTRSLPDLKLGGWMSTAARRRLGHAFEYLGYVESDETVWLAARRRRPLMAEYPEAKVAKNIERIARRVLSTESERDRALTSPPVAPPLRLDEEQTYYEILETEPGVSDEEVRRAYRTLKEIYASNSPVVAGLYDDHELAELHARANAAHDTLFAPERRRLYDLALPEADLARAVRAAAQSGRRPGLPGGGAAQGQGRGVDDRPDSPEPIVDLGDEVTGPLLRKLREARGVELADISQRTKISERHLRAIEDERFGDMPAAVYVRGYVMEYARSLRIDPQRAAESYLRRFLSKAPPAPAPDTPADR